MPNDNVNHKFIIIRSDAETREMLEKLAQHYGKTLSAVTRQAIRKEYKQSICNHLWVRQITGGMTFNNGVLDDDSHEEVFCRRCGADWDDVHPAAEEEPDEEPEF